MHLIAVVTVFKDMIYTPGRSKLTKKTIMPGHTW